MTPSHHMMEHLEQQSFGPSSPSSCFTIGLVSLLGGPSEAGDATPSLPLPMVPRLPPMVVISGCWGREKVSSSGAPAPLSSTALASSAVTLAEMVETIERLEGEAVRVVGLEERENTRSN